MTVSGYFSTRDSGRVWRRGHRSRTPFRGGHRLAAPGTGGRRRRPNTVRGGRSFPSHRPAASACRPGDAPPSVTFLPPAAARAWRMALWMPSVTNVRLDGPRGKSVGGRWVSTKTGTPFTGCRPAPTVGDLVGAASEDAGARLGEHAVNLLPVHARLGANTGARYSSVPEKSSRRRARRPAAPTDAPYRRRARRRIHPANPHVDYDLGHESLLALTDNRQALGRQLRAGVEREQAQGGWPTR